MTTPPRPIPESYWVLPDQLLAGEYPGSFDDEKTHRRVRDLLKAGIDTFIDLTELTELPSYQAILREEALALAQKITYQRLPIPDRGLPGRRAMLKVLDIIDAALAAGHHIYLHCWGGVGRTGTTVGCYLVRHGCTGQQALDELAARWQDVPKHRIHPRSPETDEQIRFILEWHEPPLQSPKVSRRGIHR
jgi:hypothetical protein